MTKQHASPKKQLQAQQLPQLESSQSSDETEDEEDEAELLAELEKIKSEKEQAKLAKQVAAEQASRLTELAENSFQHEEPSIKKRWHEDCIFKKQYSAPKPKADSFVNDAVRSEAHKKFMAKFIK